jgi:hypothetical protein
LSLVLIEKREVQPYYLFMPDRRSAPIELERQELIKDQLAALGPVGRALIRDTVTIDVPNIPSNPDIVERYYSLKRKSPLATQYRELAEMALSRNLHGLELSVHVDDLVYAHLKGNVVKAADGVYDLKAELRDTDLGLLRDFRFPVLDLTKKDMEAIARDRGFLDLLELSWFCNTPDRRMRPCGTCLPCSFVIAEGMGRRVPWQGHLKNRIWKVARPIKRAAADLRWKLLPRPR